MPLASTKALPLLVSATFAGAAVWASATDATTRAPARTAGRRKSVMGVLLRSCLTTSLRTRYEPALFLQSLRTFAKPHRPIIAPWDGTAPDHRGARAARCDDGRCPGSARSDNFRRVRPRAVGESRLPPCPGGRPPGPHPGRSG